MPLQWLNLDQSIYRKPQQRSPVSQALRTRPMQGGGGFAAAGGTMPNTFVEQQKAKWAEEDKMKKLERDAQTQKAQEMGMRIQNAYKEEQARGRQMSAQASQQRTLVQAQQQGAAKQKIEDNPEPAAKEMYNLILSMPDETQSTLLNQLFTPTSTGGTISSAGKTITTEPKYNAIAGVFLSKGWATIDKAGKAVLSEPEREFEKGTFEIVEKGGKIYKFNTATNEEIEIGKTDESENVVNEINKQANEDALELVKASDGKVSYEDAKHDALIDYGVDEEVAVDMAKFKGMPEGSKKKSIIKTFTDWLAGKKETSPETLGAPMKSLGKPAFDEANASALVDIISDDVTTAERAHLKSQGASDADIDEAIKRKGSK